MVKTCVINDDFNGCMGGNLENHEHVWLIMVIRIGIAWKDNWNTVLIMVGCGNDDSWSLTPWENMTVS